MALCGTWLRGPGAGDNHCRAGALFSMRLRVCAKAWRMSKVLIGTSGWTYDGWHGPFYPENLRKNDWLSWYTTQFPTAEINGSFYRTPSLDAVRKWRDQRRRISYSPGRLRSSLPIGSGWAKRVRIRSS